MKAPSSLALPALAAFSAVAAAAASWDDESNDAATCCKALADAGLADRVVLPDDADYEDEVDVHWSLAARLTPRCFIQPHDAGEVAKIVTTLVEANKTAPCKFAIRSGGHTTWAGAANIEDGVTVDLGLMNSTTYNEDNKTASVLPGSRWKGVYQTLDAIGIAVPGGRASTVGVGGLATGGGNSFYGAREGFVCDNVERFEVVLANGTIVEADKDSHKDLWQSLKGGSNNFGVVTRLDMMTLEGIELWGGVVTYPNDTTQQQIDALYKFTEDVNNDPYASAISIWQYTTVTGANIIISAYDYTKPEPNPPIFDDFLAIPGNTSDSLRITNMTDLAIELEQAAGFRDSFFTLTFKNDKRVMEKAIELHHEYLEVLKAADIKGNWTIQDMLQPLPKLFGEHGVEKGGNMLSLDRFDDNLQLWQTYLAWEGEEQDEMFHNWGLQYIADLEEFAKSVGADNPFLYLDYAYKTQDPLTGYGEENLEKMRVVSKKYDPEGVFQTMVPGGFKVSKAGKTEQKRGLRKTKKREL